VLQLASLRRSLMLVFLGAGGLLVFRLKLWRSGRRDSSAWRTKFMAKCRTTAMFFAPCPLRRRDWSSLKVSRAANPTCG